MSAAARARQVRALRPVKAALDPWRAQGVAIEQERQPDGSHRPALTVFLTGAECPYTCVYCDLWRFTLDGPTPPGALPAQLRHSLAEVAEGMMPTDQLRRATLKLYNASNFFEPRAVPSCDTEELLDILAPFERVVVESHPRLVDDRCVNFAKSLAQLGGGRLEIAIGLETVHPEALPKLGKQSSVGLFDQAAATLADNGIALRAFVLVGTPYVPMEEQLEWTLRTVEHALEVGAEHVSLIPVRDGNGFLETLPSLDFQEPTLLQLEATLEQVLRHQRQDWDGPGVVIADLWDLERFACCRACLPARETRLELMNLHGEVPPPVACTRCGTGCAAS